MIVACTRFPTKPGESDTIESAPPLKCEGPRAVALGFDLWVNRCSLVEIEAVEAIIPVYQAQLLNLT